MNDSIELRDRKGGIIAITTVDPWNYGWVCRLRWHKSSHGYAVANVRRPDGNQAVSYLHRMIMAAPPDMQVDHIDHNQLNNRISNLRLCTKSENKRNRIRHKDGFSSRYKGVWWDKDVEKWRAYISLNKIKINLGLFTNEIAAAQAYNAAAIEHFKDFACVNCIT